VGLKPDTVWPSKNAVTLSAEPLVGLKQHETNSHD